MKYRRVDEITIAIDDGNFIKNQSCKCTNTTYHIFTSKDNADAGMRLLDDAIIKK